jgi:predicted Zn-ribbon and HTH transcriptional regulator
MSADNNRCPKCQADMIKHPSLFPVPLSSLPKTIANNEPEKKQIAVEDQEAKFIFEFNSCTQCGFYLKT